MQVILLENIVGLGNLGNTVDVRRGYGRNFLLPQGKALPATKGNLARFEARRNELEAKDNVRKNEATTLAEKLAEVRVRVERQASDAGQLYGSVKARDIAAQLEEKGYDVPAQAVQIGEPIKALGEFSVNLVLHPEVHVSIPVEVDRMSS